jgi:hypothetical protein
MAKNSSTVRTSLESASMSFLRWSLSGEGVSGVRQMCQKIDQLAARRTHVDRVHTARPSALQNSTCARCDELLSSRRRAHLTSRDTLAPLLEILSVRSWTLLPVFHFTRSYGTKLICFPSDAGRTNVHLVEDRGLAESFQSSWLSRNVGDRRSPYDLARN